MSRPKFTIVLSELASQDLDDILQYTLETWGALQMDVYADELERGMAKLQHHPQLGRPREDLFSGCRSYLIKHHVLLYEIGVSEVRIARIVHERMNVGPHH